MSLNMPAYSACLARLLLLLCGLLGGWVLSICPPRCSCSRGHRAVDCSSRGLTKIPPGLQHNIRFLNLSFNSLEVVSSQLSHYVHLRTLDLSYNRLESLPPSLPRSLWDIRAVGNHLRSLEKNDTAYHWNLKLLDLSQNKLEKVVFINNTLQSLQTLNLSNNRFWTVPTNMPHKLETIDLSHNYLVQILPRSLDRLTRLARFYLHSNRFSWLSEGIFDKLTALELMTLGDNPWACEEEKYITKLLGWAAQTHATIFGCPCYTRPICGKAYHMTSGHSVLYTELPVPADSRGEGLNYQSPARSEDVTSIYQAKPALFETGIYQDREGSMNESRKQVVLVWMSTTFDSFTAHFSTTTGLHLTTEKPKTENSRNKGLKHPAETTEPVFLNILAMVILFNNFLDHT